MRITWMFGIFFIFMPDFRSPRAQTDFSRQLMGYERYEVRKKAPAPESKPESKKPIRLSRTPSAEAPPSAVAGTKDRSDGGERAVEPPAEESKVELGVSFGYADLDSDSNYSHRDYRGSFGFVGVRSNVWLTPTAGLTGNVRFSLGGSIPGDPANHSMESFRYEAWEAGVQMRKVFGESALSPRLEGGVSFGDLAYMVPGSSTYRMRLRTSGVVFSGRVVVPSSLNHSWSFGGRLAPRMHHREMDTSVHTDSGESVENVLLGAQAGGEWRLSRSAGLIYGIEAYTERNRFEGPAGRMDPVSGATPSNVTVSTTLFNFSLGYRWAH